MKNELRTLIENADWYIEKETDGWFLSKYSPAGEDFGFSVTEKDFRQDVEDYVNGFDPDEHASFFIDYRGTHGVPDSIKTLIDDAFDIQKNLFELKDIVDKYFESQEVIVEEPTKKTTHHTIKDDPNAETKTGTESSK